MTLGGKKTEPNLIHLKTCTIHTHNGWDTVAFSRTVRKLVIWKWCSKKPTILDKNISRYCIYRVYVYIRALPIDFSCNISLQLQNMQQFDPLLFQCLGDRALESVTFILN